MKAKHRRTLEAIFSTPTRSSYCVLGHRGTGSRPWRRSPRRGGARVGLRVERQPQVSPSPPSGQKRRESIRLKNCGSGSISWRLDHDECDTYKGYKARIEFDPRDNIFVGRVLGIEDGISFHGATVKVLKERFSAAINHYLADCKATGRRPEKPASGKLMLRIAPGNTFQSACDGRASGKSLNQWAAEVLAKAAHLTR